MSWLTRLFGNGDRQIANAGARRSVSKTEPPRPTSPPPRNPASVPKAPPSVDELLQDLNAVEDDAHPGERAKVAQRLAETRDPRAIEAACRVLGRQLRNFAARGRFEEGYHLYQTAAAIGAPAAVVIADALESGLDTELGRAAVIALGEGHHGPGAQLPLPVKLPLISKALQSRNTAVRYWAVRALPNRAASTDESRELARRQLDTETDSETKAMLQACV